jgi:hypothetical protein
VTTARFAVLVSSAAFILSGINFLRAQRPDRRDLFLRVLEGLIAPEIVAGRRALYGIKNVADAAGLAADPDQTTLVYRALAMFDVLALHAESNVVNEGTVLDEWGNSLSRSVAPAELFIAARY